MMNFPAQYMFIDDVEDFALGDAYTTRCYTIFKGTMRRVFVLDVVIEPGIQTLLHKILIHRTQLFPKVLWIFT